jgi:hypothetical protein
VLTIGLEGTNSSALTPRVIRGTEVIIELVLALIAIVFRAFLRGMLVLLDY